VEDAYQRKRTEVGDEGMLVLERVVLLRVIDSLWVEHLTAIDDMRRGIGLRAYSQRDPLNEFKVEAYRMFDELKSTIRHDITHTIFRVTLTREPPHQHQARPMVESRPDVTGAAVAAGAATAVVAGGNGSGGSPQTARAGPKLGRNDPCWCGSGKKYKRCHGA
jgi:preprotein translocase subunit SecA